MAVITEWEAVRFEHQLPQGRTKPIVLGCRIIGEASRQSEPKLVKAIGMPEVLPRMLVAEVVGNAIARRMGAPTADPCVVNISVKMAKNVNIGLAAAGAEHSIEAGPASGCMYLSAYAPFKPLQPLTAVQSQQALLIYAFDMLSQNPDRRPTNPNCAVRSTDLVAFDFGDCFSHLWVPLIGGKRYKPWEITKHGLANSHLFYRELKRIDHSIDYIKVNTERVSDRLVSVAHC